jgi:prenyltransferase beta subunit
MPFIDLARSKYFLVATAYTLNDITFANKYANSIDNYVVDQLDYNYTLLQKDASSVDVRTVQLGLSLINAVAQASKENHQTAISGKFEKQLKDYEGKFSAVLGKQQQ